MADDQLENGEKKEKELKEPPPASCLLRPQVNWVKVGIIGLFLLATLYTFYFAKSILLPVTLALIAALVLHPIHVFLLRFRIPSVISAALVVAASVAVMALAFYPLAKPAMRWLSDLPTNVRQIRSELEEIIRPVQKVQEMANDAKEAGGLAEEEETPVQTVKIEEPGMEKSLLSWSQNLGATIGLTVAFLFFFLAFGDSLSGGFSPQGGTLFLVHQISTSISSYLFTVSLINAGLGVCVGVAMYFLGLPNAALWGIMAALANFIPYAGAIVGELIVLLVAAITFDDLWRIILPPVAYFIINSIEGTFVTPMILGKRFTINPILILAAMTLWGWMWGIIGAILAVPLLMGFKIFCDHFQPLYKLGQFMSIEEPAYVVKDKHIVDESAVV